MYHKLKVPFEPIRSVLYIRSCYFSNSRNRKMIVKYETVHNKRFKWEKMNTKIESERKNIHQRNYITNIERREKNHEKEKQDKRDIEKSSK